MATTTPLPIAPNSALRPTTFAPEGDAFFGAMGQFQTEMNASIAAVAGIAAGGAMALQYTFSTTTTDADPTPGFLRLSNATQNLSTVMRLDLVGSDLITWTSTINTFDDSTSPIKGYIRLVKNGDASKFLLFSVTALATPSGYFNVTVVPVDGSSASPFINNDSLSLMFSRNGDTGPTGATGTLLRRVGGTASSGTPTPDAASQDGYALTALAVSATFGAPTGTPTDMQPLLIRVKDNGTARALAWNSIYRASSDLPLPTSTVISKTIYIGFLYNLADSRWDIAGVLGNI